jgi:adenylate cyclase
MAEQMKASEFHRIINRFYQAATEVLVHTDALVDKLVGDEIIGLYVPGIAGPDHAQKAVTAARELLKVTGHHDSDGPWLSIGAGVHTGVAFIGAVGTHNRMSDITALGDSVNTAARLASNAKPGEVLVSMETAQVIDTDLKDCETRILKLKGREEPVEVCVVSV